MFPVEIWEIILAKFAEDGNRVQLVRMKRVCKDWYAIISQLIANTGTQWYEKCVNSVPTQFWGALLEQQNNYTVISDVKFHDAERFSDKYDYLVRTMAGLGDPFWIGHAPEKEEEAAKRQPYVWIAIHSSWLEWQTLLEKNPIVETFVGLPDARLSEHITCIATYRAILAVGDSKGYIVFFDMSNNRAVPLFEAYHGDVLREVIFWREGTEVTAISMCTKGNIKYWDIKARGESRNAIRDNRLEKGFRENRETRGTMLSSRFNCCFSVDQNVDEAQKGILEVEGETRFDEKSVTIVGDANYGHNEMSLLLVERDPHIRSVVTPTEIYTLYPYKIRKARDWARGFEFYPRNPQFYDTDECFTSPVTAILFHMIYLVLGFESGDVHIFDVRPFDVRKFYVNIFYRSFWKYFNFRPAGSKRISLGKEPIASIKLGECGMDKIFVASTRRKIHIMKFEEMGFRNV